MAEDSSSGYRIKLKELHRTGWVYYIERENQLSFSWENFGSPGDGIIVPAPAQWDEYCGSHGAEWAIGRRVEILSKIAQAFLKRRYGNGSYEITDNWIYIRPGPTLLSRLLAYFT